MLDQDRILEFLKSNGPSFPSRVAKSIKSDTLIASAHLADLSARKKVRISSLKIGASPLYYLPGQEDQLYQFTHGNLNPKDQFVLDRLKQDKMLRESDLDVLSKVSLRSLKDFAVPLQVYHNGKKELFWKWHLLTPEETNETIGAILAPPKPVEEPEPEPQPEAEVVKEAEVGVEVQIQEPEVLPEQPTEEETPAEPATLQEPDVEPEKPKVSKEPKIKKAEKPEKQKTLKEKDAEPKKPLLKKIKEKITKKPAGKFQPVVEEFFTKMDIEIQESEVIRKNSELDFLVSVPTGVGSITFYCKAKSKAKCDEKDISTAYMEAQIKKLPLLFLYTKDINKKAQEMLDSGAFQNIIVKKME